MSGVTLDTPPQVRNTATAATPGRRSTTFGAAQPRNPGVDSIVEPSRARETTKMIEPRASWLTDILCSSEIRMGFTRGVQGTVTITSFGKLVTGSSTPSGFSNWGAAQSV